MTILPNSKKGSIFNILRSSVYDGPGIRTTVFFKGCPLRCKWCHNPESWSSEPQLYFNREKCVDCMACVDVCPTGAHQINENKHIVKFGLCITCGKCINICHYDAVSIFGYEQDADGIFKEIERDRVFYDMSGGGVTLSGGEPMLQLKMVLELLKKCKENNINTCVETCGYVPQKSYKAVLPYIDTFLFDYKDTVSTRHREFTGVANELILSNLDYLYKQHADIILRCPMIPGINDTKEHFKGIADLANKYPLLRGIEILPYHNMGVSKGVGIGLNTQQLNMDTVKQEKINEWIERLNELKCTGIKIN